MKIYPLTEIENAITWVKAVRFSSEHLIGNTGQQAFGMAIDALEKQIPKLLIMEHCTCGMAIDRGWKYCSECGQALRSEEK